MFYSFIRVIVRIIVYIVNGKPTYFRIVIQNIGVDKNGN